MCLYGEVRESLNITHFDFIMVNLYKFILFSYLLYTIIIHIKAPKQ
uniref:Uncharacterized protein n=1 Tax=Myoviridae sp. ctcyQ27 TaxID=2825139 RepID=A0A8S5UFJ5_9CAUD|nr:MAG TPA: hypothetical protein [Myoviridae sp. ctcyQ27]